MLSIQPEPPCNCRAVAMRPERLRLLSLRRRVRHCSINATLSPSIENKVVWDREQHPVSSVHKHILYDEAMRRFNGPAQQHRCLSRSSWSVHGRGRIQSSCLWGGDLSSSSLWASQSFSSKRRFIPPRAAVTLTPKARTFFRSLLKNPPRPDISGEIQQLL